VRVNFLRSSIEYSGEGGGPDRLGAGSWLMAPGCVIDHTIRKASPEPEEGGDEGGGRSGMSTA